MDDMDNVQAIDLNRQRAAHSTGKKDPHGEAEGVVAHPDTLTRYNHASTVIICKDIADILTRKFPDWAWAVQPQEFGQVINIYNLNLHSEYGYTIRMVDIMNDPARRYAYRAGAEILKRFRMPNRMDRELLASAPRDANGQCIPDISDIATKKQQQEAEIAMGLATGTMEIVEDEHGHQYLKVDNR